ncbi:hypothetical protein PENSTE_c002G09013 [Penicillium steckii]|uniref:FR47-like domain-containing protein n=1 Tax=Penicillium steckii TaxID=303698 RepID=A0A1V6TSU1_9EURO|nr:hypothetical protein PENSTE_c002G09013 [Penicillium steckii]
MTAATPIYQHDAHAEILPILAEHLPQSISLFRRIQHGITHSTPTAHVLATFPPGDSGPPVDTPWLAARVDLFRGRETQLIIYSSLEKEHTSSKPIKIAESTTASLESNNNSPLLPLPLNNFNIYTFNAPESVLDIVRDQLVSLLSYIKINYLPTYLASLNDSADPNNNKTPHNNVSIPASIKQSTKKSNAVTLIPAHSPHTFLIGSLHTALFSLLQSSGSAVFAASPAALDGSSADPVPGFRVHRFDDPPYRKFFFRREDFTTDVALPRGYRFHDRHGRIGVLDSQLDLVQSRTKIPRSRDQLRLMPGAAIYVDLDRGEEEQQQQQQQIQEEEMPVGWAFLGQDGALATLHVESEHRGKGLALALSKEVMRRGLVSDGVFGANGVDFEEVLKDYIEGWVHTEVAQDNVASRRVMEKIGGEVLSTVVWTVIEVTD